MNVFPKFIIEDDNLIIAKCTYHEQLATDETKVKGGGWFVYDSEKKAFILSGSSHDFGQAKLEDIRKCVELGNVWNDKRRRRNFSKYKIIYDTMTELIPLN